MTETVEDLTIAFHEDGIEKIRELDKQILSKGAWTTVIFRYQDWMPAKQEFSEIKYSIRRYQKKNNQYWQKSKFNISSEEQARKIIDVLTGWLAEK